MKQTNNAIKFLMAQYRAIFKNANIAMAAAIAAAALAAGQAQAVDRDWAAVDQTAAGDVLKASGSAIITNDKEFNITLGKADNVLKSDNENNPVTFKAEKGTITVNGASAALAIGTSNSGATLVTLNGLNVTSGSVSISGKGADANSSKLTAKLINVGGNW